MIETNALQHIPGMQPVRHTAAASISPDDGGLASVWFTLVQHSWTSLVLVPGDRNGSAVALAWALAEFGRPYQTDPIYVLNAERMGPSDIPLVVDTLRDGITLGGRVLVAVSSPLSHHSTVPVTRAADAAVLLVRLGVTELKCARHTVASIGSSCFVGSITV